MPETATLAKDSVGDKFSVLSCADRCDKCAAQAYYRVEFKFGYLDFCRHDYVESFDKLQTLAVNVLDESWKLAA